MSYHLLKIIHILSATIMIGTGLGSAFYLYVTYKTARFTTVKEVLKIVIIADLIFTTPSVIIQLVTGLLLSDMLNLMQTDWFWVVIWVSLGVLIAWLGAVYIQYKLKRTITNENSLPKLFKTLMKIWFYLGVLSFLMALFLYYLMIYKPFM